MSIAWSTSSNSSRDRFLDGLAVNGGRVGCAGAAVWGFGGAGGDENGIVAEPIGIHLEWGDWMWSRDGSK